jgi:predicted dehydrogenase
MSGKIKAAFVGCGGFARGMHLPNMAKNPKYELYAACDIVENSAREVFEQYEMEYFTTDYEKILNDEKIDLVVITTRHDQHAPLTIQAANAGKHILCEKPMGLNAEECREIALAVKANHVKYTVGYNRGVAPLVRKARVLIKGLDEKKLIYHRIQAPFPETHWIHDAAIGGGRFVGEGCHIFDLICELVGKPPVSVYASGGTFLNPDNVKTADSGIVTITFEDGSVGTTLIASAGCGLFPKEGTEIYCAGKAIYINDFREMRYYGFDALAKEETVLLEKTDKGQVIEIDLLADAIIHDTEPPNGPVNAAKAAVISFYVNESIKTGKPIPISEKDYLF